MRIDKLTTKFQQALGDAQSVAVGQDHQFIEPLHLLAALLDQEDGTSASLLSRAGGNVPRLRDATRQAISRLPTVEGHVGAEPTFPGPNRPRPLHGQYTAKPRTPY